jgi:hypothetical protein
MQSLQEVNALDRAHGRKHDLDLLAGAFDRAKVLDRRIVVCLCAPGEVVRVAHGKDRQDVYVGRRAEPRVGARNVSRAALVCRCNLRKGTNSSR